jgi:hypothetical protein
VTRVGTQVQLDAMARQLGRSRDELIEDSLRREVAGRLLERMVARTQAGNELTADQTAALAYSELDAMRFEQEGPTRSS